MVLRRGRALAFTGLMLLVGCLRPALSQAPAGTRAALASWEQPVGEAGIALAPEAFRTSLVQTLSSVGVEAVPVDVLPHGDALEDALSAQQRLQALASEAGGAELLVVVKTEARYYSQINGRFRWVVDIESSVAPTADLDEGSTEVYQVPVFLDFQHQDAQDAIGAAGPVVEPRLARQVGAVAARL